MPDALDCGNGGGFRHEKEQDMILISNVGKLGTSDEGSIMGNQVVWYHSNQKMLIPDLVDGTWTTKKSTLNILASWDNLKLLVFESKPCGWEYENLRSEQARAYWKAQLLRVRSELY